MGLACGASPRGFWGRVVLELLTISSDIEFWCETSCHFWFCGSAGDAMFDRVVSHSSRDSTCSKSRSHAFLLASSLWLTARGIGEGSSTLVLGPLTERKKNSKLLFVTETKPAS